MARVLDKGLWFNFSTNDTAANVRTQLDAIGDLFYKGRVQDAPVPDKSPLGMGVYEFVRRDGTWVPPPPPTLPPFTPPVIPACKIQVPTQRAQVPPAPPLPPTPVVIKASVACSEFSLNLYLRMTSIERLRYQLRWGHIECPEVLNQEGWVPFADTQLPASQDKPRFVTVNKPKLLRDTTEGIVRYCCPGDEPTLRPVDVWCITIVDLHEAGYTRDVSVGGAMATNDSHQEWTYAYPVDTRLVPEGWNKKILTDVLNEAPNEKGTPTTTKAFGRQSRFGGEEVVVYGLGLTETTRIIFDWPYGGSNGWSVTATPVAVHSHAMLAVAPPMADVVDGGSIKVFLLASDSEGSGREQGDASCCYECEDGELETMRTNIAKLLLQSDDYDLCPYDQGPAVMPIRSTQSISTALDSFLMHITQEELVRHLEQRKKSGHLFSLLTLTDTAGRNLLHYCCRLAWKDVLSYCLANGGGTALGARDSWDFMPFHFAAVSCDKDFLKYLAAEMSDRLCELVQDSTRDGSRLIDMLPSNEMKDFMEDLLYRKQPSPEREEKPKKKRKKRHAWDPSRDTDVDISAVDDEGAIVL
eukprot:TRINITY_DN12748_c0_g1_i1.p1 TRINITY_DN12748_c0_g1~~TRINITY_DN12748_c0_g1_i1.p1  ORF type:complete len:582 (+),score=117.02 TRINITY_DN12748_c0_g1_i1:73-1818(+)